MRQSPTITRTPSAPPRLGVMASSSSPCEQQTMPVKTRACHPTATENAAGLANTEGLLSAQARQRMLDTVAEPMLLCDWNRTLMIHYEVEPAALQPLVPFALDLRYGKAYVSLVAFTMRRLRPRLGGRLAALLSRPVANHGFLNVRTYVRHNGEPGIYFMAEWLPNRLSALVGPRLFGLPYRFGGLRYDHDHNSGRLTGWVEPADAPGRLHYEASVHPWVNYQPCSSDSLDAFLMERYTAFTQRGRRRRYFRIWHAPWPQVRVEVELIDESLTAATGPWRNHARLLGANYSPAVKDVWIGRPRRCGD